MDDKYNIPILQKVFPSLITFFLVIIVTIVLYFMSDTDKRDNELINIKIHALEKEMDAKMTVINAKIETLDYKIKREQFDPIYKSYEKQLKE